MTTYTIGFTKKGAEEFFNLLRTNNVRLMLDVRLNNVSQLSGFAKRDDLKFFLQTLCNADYQHVPDLAPTKEILNSYKKKEMSWSSYEDKFLDLMVKRNIERMFSKDQLEGSCLLCSEHKPHFCHRRLVVEYLNSSSDLNLEVRHLF